MAFAPIGLTSMRYLPFDSGVSSLINGGSYTVRQNDELFNNAQSVIVALKQIRKQQAQYKQQVTEFRTATHRLYNDAAELGRMPSAQAAADTVRQVKSVIASYNRLLGDLPKDNLSPQGKSVLASLQAVTAGREKQLNKIGITIDSATGRLNLNEKDFTAALAGGKQEVHTILGGDKGLGALLGQALKPAVSRPLTDFLKAPAEGYRRGYGSALRYLTSDEGLFMNLRA